ncbi:MAG: cobalamin-dependent protein [Planctomycetes bacterium]|nr:cobalamin-dependent protein [Planctomycetota bacterium]
MSAERIKVLIAKPGLDGHDVGAKVVVRALMDAGFEVIYTGLRKSPAEIAAVARDEDVDVIGLSVLSGSHLPICRKFAALRREHGLETKLWVVGGNIPEKDRAELERIGVDGVFPFGSPLASIVEFIRSRTAPAGG